MSQQHSPSVPENGEEYADPRRRVVPISRHGDWPIAMRSTGAPRSGSMLSEEFRPASAGRLEEFAVVQKLLLEELQSLNSSMTGFNEALRATLRLSSDIHSIARHLGPLVNALDAISDKDPHPEAASASGGRPELYGLALELLGGDGEAVRSALGTAMSAGRYAEAVREIDDPDLQTE